MQLSVSGRKLSHLALLAALYLSGPLFFALTDPGSLPLPLLVLPFIWLFSVLFTTSWLILSRREGVHKKQAVLVSGAVASIPVLLAVFQSIHQLSIRDVLLSIGLVVLAAIYMLRADFIK